MWSGLAFTDNLLHEKLNIDIDNEQGDEVRDAHVLYNLGEEECINCEPLKFVEQRAAGAEKAGFPRRQPHSSLIPALQVQCITSTAHGQKFCGPTRQQPCHQALETEKNYEG